MEVSLLSSGEREKEEEGEKNPQVSERKDNSQHDGVFLVNRHRLTDKKEREQDNERD